MGRKESLDMSRHNHEWTGSKGKTNKKEKILIIEDEVINRRIIKNILMASYDVIEAENGSAGLVQCEEHKDEIAAILLDLTMPIMNGYEFLEAMHKADYASIPVLVMTGSSDEKTEQHVLQAGAWDFIPKPYNPTIFNIRLQNAIAKSKMATFEQVKYLSEHDPLTGLYNRNKLFEATLEMIKCDVMREYVFICVDIDHFGLYNASFGEAAGDKLLCFFADMLRASANAFGTASYGRFSNDIFCICIPFDGDQEKLKQNMGIAQERLNEYSRDYVLTISSGACTFRGEEAAEGNFSEIYLRASRSSKRCKLKYDSIMEFCNEKAREKLGEEMQITNEMKNALGEEQFVVYFQPKYEVHSDHPCGAEALVRWIHPEKGLISPGAFIPVFERNGFIAQLDYYVWEHTCRYLRKWLDDGRMPHPVSVNMSRISLYNANLDQVLLELVQKYQIPPDLLELEITESAYMTSPELMHELVDKLHKAGFVILMDDFGSDYSSLNALKDIEVDILKIDMAFIPKGDSIEKGEIILASIIKMATWLGMPVIVEGVETKQQRDFLEGAGCEMIQGYYYSRPLCPTDYEEQYIYDNSIVEDIENEEDAEYIHYSEEGVILVVDDSQMTCEMLTMYFMDSYHVQTVSSAEDALVYLRRNSDNVKLILVDNMMPGMSGIDFLRFCQNDNSFCTIPKVMITASNSAEDHLAAFQAGAYDFISKPLVKEIVVARVRHIMETAYHYTNYDRIKLEYSKQALRDAETRLLTNASFCELSNRMLSTFPEDPMALLKIDMDDFKNVNDLCGYDRGTEILQRVAAELKSSLRKCDIVGRIGGDEFAVMICGIPNKKIAANKCNEINRIIAFLGAREYGLRLSASIGLVYPIKADTAETIMAKADLALHEAKKSRKGICVIYGESVPSVTDDKKPIVLFCGGDYQTFKEVALAYGESVGFVFVENYDKLVENFESYKDRIVAVCIDMNTQVPENREEFYQYIEANGCGTTIPVLAICKLGEIDQVRQAVSRHISDLIPMPIQPDLLQARLSLVIMKKKNI
ncbi:MAG: EAL domain-containing protein [Lachnospiraceae bacterium]|nr:EAL domain-containing protein [Lachnospiraceae bacterium]